MYQEMDNSSGHRWKSPISPGFCNGYMPQYSEKGLHLVQLSPWTTATVKGHQPAWRTLIETIAWALALALSKTWESFNLCWIRIPNAIATAYMRKFRLFMERNQNPALCTNAEYPDPITSSTKCPQSSRPSKKRSVIYYPVITLLKPSTPFNEITKG